MQYKGNEKVLKARGTKQASLQTSLVTSWAWIGAKQRDCSEPVCIVVLIISQEIIFCWASWGSGCWNCSSNWIFHWHLQKWIYQKVYATEHTNFIKAKFKKNVLEITCELCFRVWNVQYIFIQALKLSGTLVCLKASTCDVQVVI